MEVDGGGIDGLHVCGVDRETYPFLDQSTPHQGHIACSTK